jgi:hypothetical protein
VLADLLTAEDVQARYRLRDPRAARRIIRQAGSLTVGGRLYVRADVLEQWEAKQAAPAAPTPTSTVRVRRKPVVASTTSLTDLQPGFWRADSIPNVTRSHHSDQGSCHGK